MSIRYKLLGALVFSGIAAIAIVGYMSFTSGKTALMAASFNQLTSVRETKARQVEGYFEQIRNQVITLSEDRMVVDAMRAFREGFYTVEVQSEVSPETTAEGAGLERYYRDDFLPRLNAASAQAASIDRFMPNDEVVRHWQSRYIAENPNPVGQKDALSRDSEDNLYNRTHGVYHPILRNYLKRFGFYDIFLVDDRTGHIVYTVFKEVDYGTSLLTGPYSDTNIARAFEAARNAIDPDFAQLVDFEEYEPSYRAPAAFIASPIFDGDERIGVLIFQMPIDRINEVMTGGNNWDADGMGATGETYLVGEDLRMRSIARGIIDDTEAYYEDLRAQGYDEEAIARITAFQTTILFQEISTQSVRQALSGDSNLQVLDGYRGHPVLSAYKRLEIADVNWVVVAEIALKEALAPTEQLARMVGFIGLGIVVVIGLGALWFTQSLTRPILALRDAATRMASGDTSAQVQQKSSDEIGQLAGAFNKMVANIRAFTQDLKEEKTRADKARMDAEAATAQTEMDRAHLARSVEEMLGAIQTFAKGDLTVELEAHTNDDIGRLFDGYNRALANMRQMIEKVGEAVSITTGSAATIRSSTDAIANDVRVQSTQVTDIAAAVEEMSMTIADNARTATRAAEITQASGSAAEQSGQVVQQTVGKIQEIAVVVQQSAVIIERLGASSNQIGEIVSVIEGIAEQTNLLALNAAIEAARAGEQGKGFAVVADEVRKLAERTTHSTQQIAEMIRSIQAETHQAVQAMKDGRVRVDEGLRLADRAAQALQDIERNIEQTIVMVSQIAAATEEQAAASAEISTNVSSIAELSTSSARGATEIAHAAIAQGELTTNLWGLVSHFVVDKKQRSPAREASRMI